MRMWLFGRDKQNEITDTTPKITSQIDRLEDVDQMVLDYVKAPSTDYAIMLTGAWGAGKTYYWKKALAPSIEALDSPVVIKDHTLKYKALHVSLFGVNSLNSLIMRIAKAKYLETDNKWINTATTLTAAAFKKYAKKYEVEGEDLELLIKTLKDVDLQRFVFCFDDLERLSKEVLLEVLGYINSMVENDGVKVVILCNEKELLAKIGEVEERIEKGDEYKPYKEKLIRFTYQMSADIGKVLSSVIKGRDEVFIQYIESKKPFIVEFYKKGECDNIRTLKFNVDIYEKLFKLMLSLELKDHQEAIRDHYLMLSMLYAIEYKKGTDAKNLEQLLDLTSENSYAIDFDIKAFNKLAGIETQDEKEPSYLEKVKDGYFGQSPAKNGSSQALLDYIRTGRFNVELLKEDVMNTLSLMQNKEISEEQQLMTILNSVWTVEDKELRDTIATILRKVRSGAFSLDLMPAAFSRIKTYVTSGFVKAPSIDNLKMTFKKGIKKAKPRTIYSDKFESTYSFMSMKVDDDTKEIADEVFNFYKELGREEYIKKFNQEFDKFWVVALDMNEYVSSRYDLLNSLNASDVFKKFKSAKNVDRQRIAAFIQSRVEYSYTAVPEESAFIKQLKTIVDDYLQANPKPSTLRRYCSYISDMLGRLGF